MKTYPKKLFPLHKKSKKTMLKISTFCLPRIVSTHLEAGIDKVVGPYLVDFGYTPAHPKENEPVSFVLNVVDATTHAPIFGHRSPFWLAQWFSHS